MEIISSEFKTVSKKCGNVAGDILVVSALSILLFSTVIISILLFIPTLGHSWKIWRFVDAKMKLI